LRTPKVQHGLVPDEAALWEPLAGGCVSAVFRSGNTVRRNSGPNADFVRRLLGHFEQAGFDGAPRHLGTDAKGREILSFIAGHVPWQAGERFKARTDASLTATARLLRRCHDLTAGTALAGASEVVCHNDLSPQNTVYRDRGSGLLPVAFIDWDLAAPGQRIYDVAHLSWQYLGLGPGVANVAEAGRQIRLICGAYGLSDRSRLIETILWWQDRCWQGIEAGAMTGDAAMARLLAAGAPEAVRLERAWVAANRAALAAALT
jgi:Phosphotransferase enzyme family